MNPSKFREALTNAEPKHAGRAARRKKSQALERQPEWRFRKRFREHSSDASLHRFVCLSKEVKRQVHAIRAHPRDVGARIDALAQAGRNAADGVARRLVDIDRNKKPFHSVSQRRTMSSAACDA